MIDHLSHSSIETYLSCPLQFYFRYIANVDETAPFINRYDKGKTTHTIIENFFKTLPTNIIEPGDLFESLLIELFEKHAPHILNQEWKKDIITYLINFKYLMLLRYHFLFQENLLDHFLPTSTEQSFETHIDNIKFTGRIDAIFQDTHTRLVDWKTGTNPDKKQIIRQAIRYSILTNIPDIYIINLSKKQRWDSNKITITPKMIDHELQNIKNIYNLASSPPYPPNKSYSNCLFCNYKLTCINYQKTTNNYQTDKHLDLECR